MPARSSLLPTMLSDFAPFRTTDEIRLNYKKIIIAWKDKRVHVQSLERQGVNVYHQNVDYERNISFPAIRRITNLYLLFIDLDP